MFPLWFKIPGHHLIPHKTPFKKTKLRRRDNATKHSRYTQALDPQEKKRLRNSIDYRFARANEINWPAQLFKVTVFFLGFILAVNFIQDIVQEAAVYDLDYRNDVKAAEQKQKEEDYETLVHSGQFYLGPKPEYTKEDALQFSQAEFERALRLIPEGLAANVGLSIALSQLCTRFSGDCEAAEKRTKFAVDLAAKEERELARLVLIH